MEELIQEIEDALLAERWSSAIEIALTLPDKCAYAENGTTNRTEYEGWFSRYLISAFTADRGPHKGELFLSPTDCYALRCAKSHENLDYILDQKCQPSLERVKFTEPPSLGGADIHGNRLGRLLQLQVDLFCLAFVNGVRVWLNDVSSDPATQSRISRGLEVYPNQQFPALGHCQMWETEP